MVNVFWSPLQPKPDSNICGSKQKAATLPAVSGELPSTSSNKPKEWSCALCQVSANTERGLDEHLPCKKHKTKVAGLLRDKKMYSSSTSPTSNKFTESRDGAGPEMKTKVEEESVKTNITVVGLNKEVEGGLDEHPLGKKHKAKDEELLGPQKWIKKSIESRGSAGQEMKTKLEEESVQADKTVVGLDQKEEDGEALKFKSYSNLCGSKQETATLPACSGELPLTSSKKPTDWSCALCQVSATTKRDLEEHLQGKKHKAKEEGLLGDQKMCSKVEEELVKATKNVGLDQKVEGEDDSENKNEEPPKKKDLNANTQNKANGIPTGATMVRKLSPRKNFKFWCEVCQVGTHSAVVMEDHKRGKKHMALSNKSKKNDEDVPPTISMTIVTPSEPTTIVTPLEPTEKVEDEDVDAVAKESSKETADNVMEKAEDEEVVVYRGR